MTALPEYRNGAPRSPLELRFALWLPAQKRDSSGRAEDAGHARHRLGDPNLLFQHWAVHRPWPGQARLERPRWPTG